MRPSTDLKERIIQESDKLFTRNGYSGTSIKQIAGAAGCTTAALYYYFEDGKAQILHEVIRSYASDIADTFAIPDAQSLPELLELFGKAAREMAEISQRISWILVDMDNLGDDEKALLQSQPLQVHQQLSAQLARFVKDEAEASNLAWVVASAYAGYSHLFTSLDLQRSASVSWEQFSETLTGVILSALT